MYWSCSGHTHKEDDLLYTTRVERGVKCETTCNVWRLHTNCWAFNHGGINSYYTISSLICVATLLGTLLRFGILIKSAPALQRNAPAVTWEEKIQLLLFGSLMEEWFSDWICGAGNSYQNAGIKNKLIHCKCCAIWRRRNRSKGPWWSMNSIGAPFLCTNGLIGLSQLTSTLVWLQQIPPGWKTKQIGSV